MSRSALRVQRVYASFSGKEDRPGAPKTISHSEWVQLLDRSALIDAESGFSEREAKACYLRAMQTRVDESATDDHRGLNFVEFLAALFRVAEVKDLSGSRAEIAPFEDAAADCDATMSPAERLYVLIDAHVKHVLSSEGRKPMATDENTQGGDGKIRSLSTLAMVSKAKGRLEHEGRGQDTVSGTRQEFCGRQVQFQDRHPKLG